MPNFNDMTDDDLVRANQRYGAEMDAIRAKRLEIKAELDRRATEDRVRQMLHGLEPGDVQILAPAAVAAAKGKTP